MNTADLLEALRRHYLPPNIDPPGAVFLAEVTAPGNSGRRIDAVHIGLWASRGYGIDACELKVSRADFQRELDDPAKADAWWPHCNRFWIVAPHESIAPPELIPAGWGLMVPNPRGARRFKVLVKPEDRDVKPSVALMATLLTRAETERVNALQWQQSRLRAQHDEELRKVRREAALTSDPKVRERLELLAELEKVTGFELADWPRGNRTDPAEMGVAIRTALMSGRDARELSDALDRMDQNLQRMTAAVGAVRKGLVEAGAADA